MLEKKLKELARSDTYPFHMPGHKRALEFGNPYAIDITEIDGFDNLHHPVGVLREEQEKAAQLYGSRKAYYLVNGSTCGILAAVSAAVPRGRRILAARNCHKAVYNSIYLRQLSSQYLYPADTRWGIQGQITPEQVKAKLRQCPDIAAVFITSPTYDGVVSDVAGIAEAAHEHGVPLIVDEAHGAHFGFHRAFPENATRLGADAVIMSVHKTLPAFTQTALLHLCSDRIDHAQVERFLGIYETSSPSYVLMSGIARSLRLVEENGQELFEKYIDMLNDFRESAADLKKLRVLGAEDFSPREAYAFDPGKILIETNGWISGQHLQDALLQRFDLQMEMASGNYVTAMTSVMDRQEGFVRLSEALHELDSELCGIPRSGSLLQGKVPDTPISPREIYRSHSRVMEIYEAEEMPHQWIPLAEAEGLVSAGHIYLYPPGIPIVVPGERFDAQVLDVIRKCIGLGLDVQGLRAGGGRVDICVVQ